MGLYTVVSAFPTGKNRQHQGQNGQVTVYHEHAVEFAETPGQKWKVGRSQAQQPLVPGMTLNGEIENGQYGPFFKETRGGNRPGGFSGGGGQRTGGGGGSTDKNIMSQVALKGAIDMCVAAQKFDPQAVDFYATACMETMLKLSGLKVDAPPQQPVAQPMAQQAPNGYQQPVNRVQQYQQPPQNGYQQQPQFAQPVQQELEDGIPF